MGPQTIHAVTHCPVGCHIQHLTIYGFNLLSLLCWSSENFILFFSVCLGCMIHISSKSPAVSMSCFICLLSRSRKRSIMAIYMPLLFYFLYAAVIVLSHGSLYVIVVLSPIVLLMFYHIICYCYCSIPKCYCCSISYVTFALSPIYYCCCSISCMLLFYLL